MKLCPKCQETKSLNAFPKNKCKKDGVGSYCKVCHNRLNFENKQYRTAYQREYKPRRKENLRKWFNELKAQLRCEVCGENHPACLDFHHKNPSDKLGDVGKLVRDGRSREIIQKEISKCTVLCANCHRKEHWTFQEVVAA